MYFEIFKRIVFYNKMDVVSCISDKYICAAMTVREILVIVPEIKQIIDSKNLSEMPTDIYEFICTLPISTEMIDRWEDAEMNETERFLVALAYSSEKLEDMRYHVCKICEMEYFSTDTMSDVCDYCSDCYDNM